MVRVIFFTLCALLIMMGSMRGTMTKGQTYDDCAGVTLNLITAQTLYNNLAAHKDVFQQKSGANLILHEVIFEDLYAQILGDLQEGSPIFDGFVFPPLMMLDFIKCPGCGILDLTDRVRESRELDWADISPYFRSHNSVYDGRVYTITLDGDMHYLYYRKDVLEQLGFQPPKTWDEYEEIAKAAHGKDWNGDGIPDYGSCIARLPGFHTQYFFFQIASAFIQSQGASEGIYFDPTTMKPLIKEPGYERAAAQYLRLLEYGTGLDVDILEVFALMANGSCALAPTWANIGPLAKDTKGLPFSTWDKIGASILPGSREAWSPEKQKWLDCAEPNLCPHAIDGVNHAPFAANGGWSAAVPAKVSSRQECALKFFEFMGSPNISNIDVMAGSGFDPYRSSHFDSNLWISNGFDPVSAELQIQGIKQSQHSPNVVIDLKIGHSTVYINDEFEPVLFKLNSGEYTFAEFADEVFVRWEAVTDLYGRKLQVADYRATIGLPPLAIQVDIPAYVPALIISFASLGIIFVFIFFGFLLFYRENPHFKYGDFDFLSIMLLGALVIFIGLIVFASFPDGGSTDDTCMSTAWLVTLGLVILYISLILKSCRIYFLVIRAETFRKAKLTMAKMMIPFWLIMVPAIVTLIVWNTTTPLVAAQTNFGNDDQYYLFCSCDTVWFAAGLLIGAAVIMMFAVYVAVTTRNLAPGFNESKYLAFSIYNGVVIGIVICVLVFVINDPIATMLIFGLGLVVITLVPILLVFGPKTVAAIKQSPFQPRKHLITPVCPRCKTCCLTCGGGTTGMTGSGTLSSGTMITQG